MVVQPGKPMACLYICLSKSRDFNVTVRSQHFTRDDIFILIFKVLRRPCKKWASFGDRCVEKILAPKSKYIDTSKPG